jgi:GNAT superfamily N-acetyltransferase
MNVDIRALSPENKLDFARLLEGADFDHAPEWKSCFCRYYHTSCPFSEWIGRSAEVNREESLVEIEAGRMRGFLAYAGTRCVGWLNANRIEAFPRLASVKADLPEGQKIGITLCFVVDPAFRGQGIAGKLLNAAIEGFVQEGFDAVVALPFADATEARMYRGRLSMYLSRGFVPLQEKAGVTLVHKSLSPRGKAVLS